MEVIPFVWIILVAFLGASIGSTLFQRRGNKPLIGAVLGAVVGTVLGALSEIVVVGLLIRGAI